MASVKLYRFSPIKSQDALFEAIKYINQAGRQLCEKILKVELPIAGNVGVFCHYPNEYQILSKIRVQLTIDSVNFKDKYFRLRQPIFGYEYLYIRQPDPYRSHVGDIDLVMDYEEYEVLKDAIKSGDGPLGARVFERPQDDMIELFDPEIDVLVYLTTKTMDQKVTSS